MTDGLAQKLAGKVELKRPNVRVLPVRGDPKPLLRLPQEELDAIAGVRFSARWARSFRAPNRVALYLFDDGSWVVENFNDEAVTVELDGKPLSVTPQLGVPLAVGQTFLSVPCMSRLAAPGRRQLSAVSYQHSARKELSLMAEKLIADS